MTKLRRFRRSSQRGVSILEVLLGVAVFAVLGYFVIKMQVQFSQEQRAKRLAESTNAAAEVFSNYLLSNRDGIVKAMADGTDAASFCKINVDPATGAGGTIANNVSKHTCAVDLSFMKYKKMISVGHNELNDQKQRITAIFRLVYEDDDGNPATAEVPGTVEMLVGGAVNGGKEQAADADFVSTAANYVGFNGGFIPDNAKWGGCTYQHAGSASEKQACGAGGGWKIDLSDFLDTP